MPTDGGRWACGSTARSCAAFRRPSGKLEFFSSTLAQWGWREVALPGYIVSHVHPRRLEPGQMPLISTFRLPVHIHTRSANAKWLDEIAHSNPLWLHPTDALRLGIATGDLVRVETEIGHFVVKAWVTEGIRPGVVACSHHMGRWKLENGTGQNQGQRQMMATVALDRSGSDWGLRRERGVEPYASSDPDTLRIWWSDAGVHQNLTFPVHPDPISGMHCWHQAVRVTKALPGDGYGDIAVDTDEVPGGLRGLARQVPAGRSPLPRRHPPPGVAHPSGQADGPGVQTAREVDAGAPDQGAGSTGSSIVERLPPISSRTTMASRQPR